MRISPDILRGRIGELTDCLMAQLAAAGLPEEGQVVLRGIVEAQLAGDRLRPLVEACLHESVDKVLDRFVLSFDPGQRAVVLACKN